MRPFNVNLTVNAISFYRNTFAIIDTLSLTHEPGSALLVMGDNGSGKTTMLKLLAGLLTPHAGEIEFVHANGMKIEAADCCHYLGHLNGLKNPLTVKENLDFWRNFYPNPALTVMQALQEAGLSHTHALPFGILSQGQKRRVAFARLLLNHRAIWLLDEPTAGLDTSASHKICSAINKHLQMGGSVIATTHRPLEIDNVDILRLEN